MKFRAEINVIPGAETKNTEGKKIIDDLKKARIDNIENITIGKFYTFEVEANSYNAANAFVGDACKNVFAKNDDDAFDFTIDEI